MAEPVGAIVPTPVQAVAVVVPAHDEQDLIGACVAGIRQAAAHPALANVVVHLVVVLDDCRDASGWRAVAALSAPDRTGTTMAATVISVSARNVGRARALGAAQAFLTLGAIDAEAVWLATTDADSVVPGDWLAHHLELRRGGADACAGTIVVDSWQEHTPSTKRAFDAHYRPDGRMSFGHPHVHGTNLGVSMAAYLEAGGFSPLATGEDHALWRALLKAGRPVVATPAAPVRTSGRRRGRSPAGFADTLIRLGADACVTPA
ncbi:MAG: glycosyltransferase [Actinomycetota bacterium]|nr:glycosyltransferase [Actinomycetota bacterium]